MDCVISGSEVPGMPLRLVLIRVRHDDKSPLRLPAWLYCVLTVEVRCELRWCSWWRNINTRTTLSLDNEWVWINLNWGWVGGGQLPLP